MGEDSRAQGNGTVEESVQAATGSRRGKATGKGQVEFIIHSSSFMVRSYQEPITILGRGDYPLDTARSDLCAIYSAME